MPDSAQKTEKVYYSIGEVAEMVGVSESLLRFWETKFPALSPRKGGRGVRQYTLRDVQTVRLIYHLTKEQGMTLQGAQKRLQSDLDGAMRRMEALQRLQGIRDRLVAIQKGLEHFSYKQLDTLRQGGEAAE